MIIFDFHRFRSSGFYILRSSDTQILRYSDLCAAQDLQNYNVRTWIDGTRGPLRIPFIAQILRSWDPQVLRPTGSQVLRFSDPQILRFSDPQILRYSSPQILRFSDPQILKSADSKKKLQCDESSFWGWFLQSLTLRKDRPRDISEVHAQQYDDNRNYRYHYLDSQIRRTSDPRS